MPTVSGPTYTGTLVGSDGSKLVVRDAELVPPVTTPLPLPPPLPPPSPPPVVCQLSIYLKMWSGGGRPGLAAAAKPGITEVRLAFIQGSPPRLVGWGNQTREQVVADAAALRARGVAVTASAGGQGGAIDTRSREAFIQGVAELHATIGLDRLDWDVETSALVATDVLAISQLLHDRYGLMFTMAPNGSNVGTYLPVAVELHKRGLLAAYGQQFYGSTGGVTLPAASWRIEQAVSAGLPPRVIQIGMWVGDNDLRRWPMSVCRSNMNVIRTRWPDIGGAYLWSETHAEVTEWASAMTGIMI